MDGADFLGGLVLSIPGTLSWIMHVRAYSSRAPIVQIFVYVVENGRVVVNCNTLEFLATVFLDADDGQKNGLFLVLVLFSAPTFNQKI